MTVPKIRNIICKKCTHVFHHWLLYSSLNSYVGSAFHVAMHLIILQIVFANYTFITVHVTLLIEQNKHTKMLTLNNQILPFKLIETHAYCGKSAVPKL